MKAKKRLEIVWETHEITTICFKGNYSATFFCQACRLNTPHLSLAQAAAVANMSETMVFRLVEAGEFHYLETETGDLLICGDSLSTENKKH